MDLLRDQPRVFAYVGLAGALALVPALAVPLLIRAFVDQYLVAELPGSAAPAVIGLLGAAGLLFLLSALQQWILARLATRLSAQQPTAFVWHALRAPVPELDALGAAQVSARGAVLQAQSFQAGYLVPMSMVNIANLLVFAVALLALDLRLGAAALLVVVVSTGASARALAGRSRPAATVESLRVRHSAATTATLTDIESVKAAGRELWIFDRWAVGRSELGAAVARLGVLGQRLGAIPPLTQSLGLGVVLGVGAALVLAGELTLGTLAAAQGLLVGVLVPASLILYTGTLLQNIANSGELAATVTRLPLDVEVGPVATPAQLPAEGIGLEFVDVTFGYDRAAAPLLDGLNLAVRPGQTVAVVGGSGSGKSTLIRLAVGEFQPWSGSIRIGGCDRLGLPRAQRARALAYAPQTPALAPGTILENLTLFDPGVPLERVLAAARDAVILQAIDARPLGLGEHIDAEGHGFSGGELQRLAIARALVADPAILVLDEATSALDPIVEAQIEANLAARGTTRLVVAHRISAVRDADLIVVLAAGRIVAQGSFAELRTGGPFRELLDEH